MSDEASAPVPPAAGRPLDGLLVLDLSRVLSGPFATLHLGMFGARVVKIEHPKGGDDTRGFGPPFVGDDAAYFLSVNSCKESVALDLKDERARAIIRGLAARADIVVENFRPGTMDKLGLAPAALMELNPRLIYCAISGYGHAGDPRYSKLPGYDIVMQGVGGIPSLTGPPDGAPFRVGVAVADLVSGLYATIGILLALHARSRSGRGQLVDVSMQDAMIGLLTYQAGSYFATGKNPRRQGNAHANICPYDAFQASDGYFNLGCGSDPLFVTLCDKLLGRPDLPRDPRFATNAARVQNREALYGELCPLFVQKPMQAWLEGLEQAGIPAGPILTVDQALHHPQLSARGMIVELPHPAAGTLRVTGAPVRLGQTPGAVDRAPPLLGQDSLRVLGELAGLDEAQLAALVKDGVTRGVTPAPR
jgi:crotonobetainyl-CoA:carnitine CoA-transferase CaiB-like acyl-CoA transferase